MKIRIETGPLNRVVYQGDKIIATIHDHRRWSQKSKEINNIAGNWGVAWMSGRYDWHDTYSEAMDNALKG